MADQGTVLEGRYQLDEKIGAGGTGEVWRAKHLTLNSVVAIKLLHVGASHRFSAQRRFLQEARVTAKLRSKHAVHVFDFGFTSEGRPFLVMELLDGETLRARLNRIGQLGPRTTTIVLRRAARALERAHGLGIVHRDFKPDNVFVIPNDEGYDDVKVVDFGIAKLVGTFEPEDSPPAPPVDQLDPVTFTRTGHLLGTPYYMAPEQVSARPDIGLEVDIWAFGVVAYECLVGRNPFDAPSASRLFKNILEGAFQPASHLCADAPAAFDDWFQRACHLDPARRFPDIRTAATELHAALGVVAPDRFSSETTGTIVPARIIGADATIDFSAPSTVISSQPSDPATRALAASVPSMLVPSRSSLAARLIIATAALCAIGAGIGVGLLMGRHSATAAHSSAASASAIPIDTPARPAASSVDEPLPAATSQASSSAARATPPRPARTSRLPAPAPCACTSATPPAPPEPTEQKPPPPPILPPLGL